MYSVGLGLAQRGAGFGFGPSREFITFSASRKDTMRGIAARQA